MLLKLEEAGYSLSLLSDHVLLPGYLPAAPGCLLSPSPSALLNTNVC